MKLKVALFLFALFMNIGEAHPASLRMTANISFGNPISFSAAPDILAAEQLLINSDAQKFWETCVEKKCRMTEITNTRSKG